MCMIITCTAMIEYRDTYTCATIVRCRLYLYLFRIYHNRIIVIDHHAHLPVVKRYTHVYGFTIKAVHVVRRKL